MKSISNNQFRILAIVLICLTFLIVGALTVDHVQADGVNFYVRPGGDDANCDGLVDVDYPGSGPTSCAKQTIQAAINAAGDNDIVNIANGNYPESLNIYKTFSLVGESEAGVIIDAAGILDYAIDASGDFAFHFEQFTLIGGPSPTFGYGLKISGDNATATVDQVTVQNSGRSGIDLNGLSGGTLTDVSVINNGGVGLALTDCSNVTIEGITTSGNAWGGLAIFTYGVYHTGGSDGITLQGTNSFAEPNALYTTEDPAFPISNFSQSDFPYTVHNDTDAPNSASYQPNAVTALAAALSATTPQDSYIIEFATGEFYVSPGMSIQAAIDAASSGDTINIAAGTYIEDLNVNKEVSIIGAGVNQVTIDLTGSPGHNGAGIYVSANNVTLQGFTLAGPQPSTSVPRYGIKFGTVSGGALSDLVVRDIYRSGYDLLGTSDTTINNIESRDNGGHGLALTDCNNITLTDYTALGNGWQAISIATWGQYTLLGTSGIVLNGPFNMDNVPQLEMGDYNNPGVAPSGDAIITYSSNPADGADVTFDASDFGYALHGDQDDSPDQVRIWFFATLADARTVAAIPPPIGHLTGDDMYIEDLADPSQLYVCPQCTIQAAVDAASSGDTINIDAGTFEERVVIDKSLTLSGAGAGTNPVAHTILDGSGLGAGASGFHILVNITDVTIEDLTVQNYTLSSSNYAGISGAGSNDNFTTQRVHTLANTGGRGGLYLNGPVDTVLIDNITSHDNQGRGIVIWNGHKTNITITNNDVRRNNCCGIELQDGTSSGVTMSGNTVVDNADSGISALGLTSGAGPNVFANNTISNNGRFGLEIKNPDGTGLTTGDGSIVIEDNIVTFTPTGSMDRRDHAGIAVFRRSFQSGNPNGYVDVPTGVVLRNNTVTGYRQERTIPSPTLTSEGFGLAIEGNNHIITGNTLTDNDIGIQLQGGMHPYANYVFEDVGDGDQEDGMSPEYFGRGNAPVACGNTVTGNSFSGSVVADRRDRIISSSVGVTNLDTGIVFCSIQTAHDNALTLDGHTLSIGAGTHLEGPQIVIDKNVSIVGAGEGVTILNPTADTGSAGDARGWFLVNSGAVLDLSNLTLDGTGYQVYQGIRHKGSGTIDHVSFNEIKYPGYAGVAVAAFGDGPVDVSNSTFTEIGRVGVLYFGAGISGSTFDGNTYTGKGAGDWLDYALDISAGAVINVTNNTISNNNGVASSDGSTSAGFLVTTYFAGGTTVDFSYNNISNNSTGIFVGYDGSDTSTVTAQNNCFTGNDEGLVSTNPTVDATNNAWGDPSGPYHSALNPAGTGDEVSNDVIFVPWLDTCGGLPTGDNWYNVDQDIYYVTQQAALDYASTGETIQMVSDQPGGGTVTIPGITIDLNGLTGVPGSPFLTVAAADVIVENGTLDGLGSTDPAILIQSGGDNFTLRDAEVTGWQDGVEIEASVTSFKLIGNWIHTNTNAGLQVNTGVTIGGIVTIEGNLFKVNGGLGINNASGNNLVAEYNSWGHIDGPELADGGDGISADVDAVPYTYSEIFMDMVPDSGALTRNVNENNSFDVAIKADAVNLYGLTYRFTYDTSRLTLNSTAFSSPWAGRCFEVDPPQPAGTIFFRCSLIIEPEWTATGGTIATFNFTAEDNGGLTGDGPWTADFDIDHVETTSAATGGVKVYVNNAGFNDPSVVPDRDITDTEDGRVNIIGIAQFAGFIDLQGTHNDSGAILNVYNQSLISGATAYAQATSSAGGSYTTSYLSPNQLAIGTTYWFNVDAPLYLPTTEFGITVTDFASSAALITRPLTSLGTLVLLGGDGTDDDVIDILDLACIGASYQTVSICGGGPGADADVNQDGVIDILDLVLMGGNYDLSSSPWAP